MNFPRCQVGRYECYARSLSIVYAIGYKWFRPVVYYGKLLHDFLVDLLIAMMNLKPPVFKSVNKCCLLYVSSSVMLSTILHQGHIGLVGHGWYLWGDKVWDCCIATTLPNLTRSGAISHHLMSYIPHAPLGVLHKSPLNLYGSSANLRLISLP